VRRFDEYQKYESGGAGANMKEKHSFPIYILVSFLLALFAFQFNSIAQDAEPQTESEPVQEEPNAFVAVNEANLDWEYTFNNETKDGESTEEIGGFYIDYYEGAGQNYKGKRGKKQTVKTLGNIELVDSVTFSSESILFQSENQEFSISQEDVLVILNEERSDEKRIEGTLSRRIEGDSIFYEYTFDQPVPWTDINTMRVYVGDYCKIKMYDIDIRDDTDIYAQKYIEENSDYTLVFADINDIGHLYILGKDKTCVDLLSANTTRVKSIPLYFPYGLIVDRNREIVTFYRLYKSFRMIIKISIINMILKIILYLTR
jgi:hypothetical protein